MEIKNNNSALGLGATLALAAGMVLAAFSVVMLPEAPAQGFPWEFTLFVASFGLLSVGTWCLGTLLRRRRNGTVGYGRDNGAGGAPIALWIIIAGVLLLCFDTGVVPSEWRRVIFSWQTLLLVGGMNELGRRRFVPAVVLLAVGGFFILRKLDVIYPDISWSGVELTFWPTALIIVGIALLARLLFGDGCRCSHGRRSRDGRGVSGRGESHSSGVVEIEVLFGGSDQIYLDEEFRGGKISTVFGGVKLDLRRTSLPEGETHLRIESVFGGVEIDAPEEWQIEIRNSSVFGGFNDKRLPPLGTRTDDRRKLIIHANNVFGGGEIK